MSEPEREPVGVGDRVVFVVDYGEVLVGTTGRITRVTDGFAGVFVRVVLDGRHAASVLCAGEKVRLIESAPA